MNFLPSSAAISEAEGRMYLGQSGLTTRLLTNSVTLGLAPSISSINKGFEVLWMVLARSGTG